MVKQIYPAKENSKSASPADDRLIKAIRSSSSQSAFDRALSDLEKEIRDPSPSTSHRFLSEILTNAKQEDAFRKLETLLSSSIAPQPTSNSDFIDLALHHSTVPMLNFLLDHGFTMIHTDKKVDFLLHSFTSSKSEIPIQKIIPFLASHYEDKLAKKCAQSLFMGTEEMCLRLNRLWNLVDNNHPLSHAPCIQISQQLGQLHYLANAQESVIEKAVRQGLLLNWVDFQTIESAYQELHQNPKSNYVQNASHQKRFLKFVMQARKELLDQSTVTVPKAHTRPRL